MGVGSWESGKSGGWGEQHTGRGRGVRGRGESGWVGVRIRGWVRQGQRNDIENTHTHTNTHAHSYTHTHAHSYTHTHTQHATAAA